MRKKGRGNNKITFSMDRVLSAMEEKGIKDKKTLAHLCSDESREKSISQSTFYQAMQTRKISPEVLKVVADVLCVNPHYLTGESTYSDEESIPISVINDLISELSEEQEDLNNIVTHAIITLQLLKSRWERIQNERGS